MSSIPLKGRDYYDDADEELVPGFEADVHVYGGATGISLL